MPGKPSLHVLRALNALLVQDDVYPARNTLQGNISRKEDGLIRAFSVKYAVRKASMRMCKPPSRLSDSSGQMSKSYPADDCHLHNPHWSRTADVSYAHRIHVFFAHYRSTHQYHYSLGLAHPPFLRFRHIRTAMAFELHPDPIPAGFLRIPLSRSARSFICSCLQSDVWTRICISRVGGEEPPLPLTLHRICRSAYDGSPDLMSEFTPQRFSSVCVEETLRLLLTSALARGLHPLVDIHAEHSYGMRVSMSSFHMSAQRSYFFLFLASSSSIQLCRNSFVEPHPS